MTRRLLTAVGLTLQCLVLSHAATEPSANVPAVPPPPDLGARAYVLVDHQSRQPLASKNSDERLDPASITKLMTAYATFRALAEGQIGLGDPVLVSEKAWRTGGSRTFIEVGTQVSVEDLLQGMIVQSGNDASVALAEHVGGTEETFAELMNQYARELGMANTQYRNSTGLPDPEHYTTAADIALLANAIIADFPQYYRWYSQREFTYNGITQHNRNALLFRDPSVDGMKTGYTENAGYCLVTSAERDGMRLVSVVLGADSPNARARESQALLNYGFRFYETRLVYAAGAPVTETKVWKGASERADLGVASDVYITVPRGSADNIAAEFEVPAQLVAPVDSGVELGRIRLNLADETVAEATLVTLAAVAEGSVWQRARDSVLLWFE